LNDLTMPILFFR